MTVTKKVPPDGGYAWIIMCAYAINHFFCIPIMQNFGLIYKETFESLEFTATEISMILNSCAAFSMLIGIINGPLLKHLGFRKVSLIGAGFITTGILLTSRATKFKHFMITYGVITSIGMGIGMTSYSLALNSYFTTKRGKATGLGMTLAGLGPVVMPQFISFLLYTYGVQGAMTILGGIVSHSFISASLLQPVKWHMKDEIIDEEKNDDRNDDDKTKKEDVENEAAIALDSNLSGSMWSLNEERQRLASISSHKRRKSIKKSVESLNDNKFLKENEKEKDKEEREPLNPIKENGEKTDLSNVKDEKGQKDQKDDKDNEDDKDGKVVKKKEKQTLLKRIGHNIMEMFDLKLLKDPIYLNIMFGMSLAIFAEMNFSVLTPFILGDYNLTVPQIATFMSVISILDITFRFCAPFIGDFLKQSHRVMYLVAMILLIVTRFSLLLTGEYKKLLIVAAALGVAKGFRTVYYSLVIPSYVPIERFAAAAGIQMTVNGIVVLLGGPVIGYIRDLSGNYRNCIYVINAVTFATFLMWTVEMLYIKYKNQNKVNDDNEKT